MILPDHVDKLTYAFKRCFVNLTFNVEKQSMLFFEGGNSPYYRPVRAVSVSLIFTAKLILKNINLEI